MSIYVLRSDNLLKIGFTDDIRGRVQSIISMIPVPVEFVGHMPGGREVEAHFHHIFRESRFSGEWFVETAEMRLAFEAILIPGLPSAPTDKSAKRVAEIRKMSALSARIKDAAASRWPSLSKGERLSRFQSEIGWNKARAKDAFYAHPKMALRGFELEELEAWLSISNTQTA